MESENERKTRRGKKKKKEKKKKHLSKHHDWLGSLRHYISKYRQNSKITFRYMTGDFVQ